MLGLSDRGAIRALLGLLLAGDARGALAALRDQYDLGVEPSSVLRGLLESVHAITRAKVGGAEDPAQSAEEREAYSEWASLSYAAIHRLWQLLLKGLAEVHAAPMPLEAAEMALLRVVHASELPDPASLMERLASGEAVPARAAAPGNAKSSSAAKVPENYAAFVTEIGKSPEQLLWHQLQEEFRVVSYEPPILRLQPAPKATDTKRIDKALALLRQLTKELFGEAWRVELSDGAAEPSLRDQEVEAERALRQNVLDSPAVRAAFEAFPGAELAGYRLDEQRSA
jgi:DNA polymerase-3 subunit gamma/tau